MLERLEEIKKQGLEKINSAKSSKELEEIRRELLGKKSPLTEVIKNSRFIRCRNQKTSMV